MRLPGVLSLVWSSLLVAMAMAGGDAAELPGAGGAGVPAIMASLRDPDTAVRVRGLLALVRLAKEAAPDLWTCQVWSRYERRFARTPGQEELAARCAVRLSDIATTDTSVRCRSLARVVLRRLWEFARLCRVYQRILLADAAPSQLRDMLRSVQYQLGPFGGPLRLRIAGMLRHDDPEVVAAAFGALGSLGRAGIGPLSTCLRDAPDAGLRAAAAESLALAVRDSGDHSGRESLLRAFEDMSPRVRAAAVRGLWVTRPLDGETVDRVASMANDADDTVREAVAAALGDLQLGVEEDAALKLLLRDPMYSVRAEAVVALAKHASVDQASLSEFWAAFDGAPEAAVLRAARGLYWYCRDERSEAELRLLAADGDPLTRSVATWELSRRRHGTVMW